MKKLLWKLYYRTLYGKDYATRLAHATMICRVFVPMNVANYTVKGEIIRERVHWQPRYTMEHPLVKKYSNS